MISKTIIFAVYLLANSSFQLDDTANYVRSQSSVPLVNGIDRADSNRGYIKENCLPCCETCNKAKRDLAIDDFYNWLKRAYYHSLSLGIITT